MAPGTSISSIVGGSLQFAGQNWITVMSAIGQGVELIPVAELERGTAGYAEWLVAADSSFQSIEDLDGAKVGVVATPGNCDLIPLAALAESGLDVNPQFLNIAVPDMPGTLERGDIDAACVPEPTLSAMKASGNFRSVYDLFSGAYLDFPVSGVFASAEFASTNPNTVAAVQRALARANAMIQENEQLVRDIVPQYTPVPPEAANVMTLPSYPDTDFKALQAAVRLVEGAGLASGLQVPGVTD
jgi:NitT/TauT family transport system substrate-binding protein